MEEGGEEEGGDEDGGGSGDGGGGGAFWEILRLFEGLIVFCEEEN